MCVLTHQNQVVMQITSQFLSFPSIQPLKYLVFTMSATTRSYEKSQWTRVRFPTRRDKLACQFTVPFLGCFGKVKRPTTGGSKGHIEPPGTFVFKQSFWKTPFFPVSHANSPKGETHFLVLSAIFVCAADAASFIVPRATNVTMSKSSLSKLTRNNYEKNGKLPWHSNSPPVFSTVTVRCCAPYWWCSWSCRHFHLGTPAGSMD